MNKLFIGMDQYMQVAIGQAQLSWVCILHTLAGQLVRVYMSVPWQACNWAPNHWSDQMPAQQPMSQLAGWPESMERILVVYLAIVWACISA